MSGKHEDILESIQSHFPPEKWEEVERVVSILSRHQPKVDIDRVYQSELRNSLLTPESSIMKISIPWLHIASWVGIFCTSFIAVFGFWKMLSPTIISSPERGDSKQIWAIPLPSRGEVVTEISPQPSSQRATSDTPLVATSITKKQVDAFLAEKWSIDREVANIGQDMLDMSNITEKSTLPLVVPVAKQIISEKSWPKNTLLDPTSPSASSLSMMSPRLALPVKVGETLVYPSVMQIYKKSGIWTDAEILVRSGSGSVVEKVMTEKRSIIVARVEKLVWDRSIVKSEIAYRVLTRMARDPEGLSYLVPVIIYSTDSSENIIIPLVRGYR